MKTWSSKHRVRRRERSKVLSQSDIERCRGCIADILAIGSVKMIGADITAVPWTPIELRIGVASILGAAVAKQSCPEEAFEALMCYLRQATDEEMDQLMEATKEAKQRQLDEEWE